jgi:hypothetical protein
VRTGDRASGGEAKSDAAGLTIASTFDTVERLEYFSRSLCGMPGAVLDRC